MSKVSIDKIWLKSEKFTNYVSEIAGELVLASYTHKLGLDYILFTIETET